MEWFMGKGRRKDKDCPTPPTPDQEQKEYLDDPNTKDRISDADFFKLVALPPSLDINEWMTSHTISLFNHVNLIYGVVSQYCTPDTCPAMTAPDNVQYNWSDDKGKKSKNTACQYINYVMAQIEQLINDESIFPTKFGQPFAADCEAVIKRIHKYLFQVLAHLYHAHYRFLRQLGLHAHLNTLFTHFMVFASKFDLIQDKDSDILLNLFSLLLKNLADPSQNPQLREELEEKAAAQREKQRQYEEEENSKNSEKNALDTDRGGDDSDNGKCDSNNGGVRLSPSVHSSTADGDNDNCISPSGMDMGSFKTNDNSCDNENRHSPSSLDKHLNLHQLQQSNGNACGDRHSSNPTTAATTTTTLLSSSSTANTSQQTLIPSSDNIRRSARGDSDGSKPPTDWLGGMQISAT